MDVNAIKSDQRVTSTDETYKVVAKILDIKCKDIGENGLYVLMKAGRKVRKSQVIEISPD